MPKLKQSTDFDVVIAGGGPVGASLACALGGQPLRIAVVEPLPYTPAARAGYDDRTLALAYGSRRVFESMAVWERLSEHATPIREIHVSDRGHFGAARMRAESIGFDALGYVVENRILAEVLAATLAGQDNVELICPARLKSLETGDQRMHVEVEEAGRTRTVTTRLLVGADGGQSMVRKLGGIDAETVDYRQSAIIANVTAGRPHQNRAWERFTDSGPLALLPMSGDRCSLVWTVARSHSDEMLAMADADFLAALQRRFGFRLGIFERAGVRAAYPLTRVRAERHVAARLALIGNAAHTLHPVAGQGFNLGLRDVAVLAEVIAGAAGERRDIGDSSVLSGYQRLRQADQRRILTLTDGLVRVFSNDFTPLVIARNAGMIALDLLPPLKRMLMRQTMGLAGRLPRLARSLPQ